MNRILPRFYRHQEAARDQQKIARNLLESGDMADIDTRVLSLIGDERQLRGIPALARGVGGTIHGTNPLAVLMAKQPRDQ